MAESKNVLAKTPCTEVDIRSRILTVRGVQVMLDWELAGLYGVETRVLNQAVKRNMERFPQRFRFQLTRSEKVIVDHGTVMWPGGEDLCPDDLYDDSVKI